MWEKALKSKPKHKQFLIELRDLLLKHKASIDPLYDYDGINTGSIELELEGIGCIELQEDCLDVGTLNLIIQAATDV